MLLRMALLNHGVLALNLPVTLSLLVGHTTLRVQAMQAAGDPPSS